MNFNFDPNSLTVGELVDIEEVSGADAMAGLSDGKVSPKALLALVWVLHRRDDPTFTLDQARTIKVTDLKVDAPGTNGDGQTTHQG